jgi:hypothetical protein
MAGLKTSRICTTDARGEATDGDRVEADGRVFAVQEDDDEILAIHGTEVLAQQRGGLLGTMETGGRGGEGGLAYQGHTVDRDAVRAAALACTVAARCGWGVAVRWRGWKQLELCHSETLPGVGRWAEAQRLWRRYALPLQ